MQIIQTDAAPQALGTYSQAIKVGDVVYCSGQIGLNPQTQTLVNDDFRSEATQAFRNLQAVVTAAGGAFADIVKITVYLTDFADFPVLNEVMATFFTAPYPARTTVAVAALPKAAKFEVDATLILPRS